MQEERQTFKLLADPITAELEKQGLNEITAGIMSANLVEAQIESLKNMGYLINLMRKEASTNK